MFKIILILITMLFILQCGDSDSKNVLNPEDSLYSNVNDSVQDSTENKDSTINDDTTSIDTTKNINTTSKIDTIAPTISFTAGEKINIVVGTTISEIIFVASDNCTPKELLLPTLKKDSSFHKDVSLLAVGEYTITYSVEDTSGNIGKNSVTLNIYENSDKNRPNISVAEDSVSVFIDQKLYLNDFSVTATDSIDNNLSHLVYYDDSEVDYENVGTYKILFSVKNSRGFTQYDSTFVKVNATIFHRLIVKSGRSKGKIPEIGIYIHNADYENNITYDGLKFRIYLEYPEGWFNENAQNGYQDIVQLADWSKKNRGSKGIVNLVDKYETGNRTRKLDYITDEDGKSFVEIDLPTSKEIDDARVSASLAPGEWMMIRINLWTSNYDDKELAAVFLSFTINFNSA